MLLHVCWWRNWIVHKELQWPGWYQKSWSMDSGGSSKPSFCRCKAKWEGKFFLLHYYCKFKLQLALSNIWRYYDFHQKADSFEFCWFIDQSRCTFSFWYCWGYSSYILWGIKCKYWLTGIGFSWIAYILPHRLMNLYWSLLQVLWIAFSVLKLFILMSGLPDYMTGKISSYQR